MYVFDYAIVLAGDDVQIPPVLLDDYTANFEGIFYQGKSTK